MVSPAFAILLSFLMGDLVVAASSSLIDIIGRVPSPPQAQTFTWPYTSIKFAFIGSEANFTFTTSGQNAFALSIDGSDLTTAPKTIFDGSTGPNATFGTGKLAKGFHTVEMFRVTEADHGSIVFGGVKTDGNLVPVNPSPRRIEFVGDSITVGYGVDGTLPCTDSVITENAAKTYAAIVGKNLSADISLVAWSGRGVLRNYPAADGSDPNPTMPTLWKQTGAYDTMATYTFPKVVTPQAVVVNLGTNDFAYLTGPADASGNPTASRPPITQAQYQNAITNFTMQIQHAYPTVPIFLVSSPMLSDGYPAGQNQHSTQLAALQAVASSLKNVIVVDLPSQTGAVGCDYHPSPATHQQMAQLLIPVMKTKLGW